MGFLQWVLGELIPFLIAVLLAVAMILGANAAHWAPW